MSEAVVKGGAGLPFVEISVRGCAGPGTAGLPSAVTEAGNATFNAREGAHDDLVLALALAVFGLSRPDPVDAVRVAWAR